MSRVSSPHAMTVASLLDALDVDAAVGLSPSEVEQRRAEVGENRLVEVAPRARWRAFLDQFRNVLVALLVVGAVIAAAIGDVKDAVAIAVVLLFNASLGYYQEQRAASSLAALRQLLILSVRVRREGRVIEVPAEALVPGDIVLLEAGQRVPADGRVLESWSAEIDESSLTGESAPVPKDADSVLAPDAALGDRSTAVFMNTQVTQGRLVLAVTDTGMATQIGQVADLLNASDDHGQTPLQRQLDQLGKRLAALSGAVVAAYFALGLLRGQNASDLVISSVALIVAAIPEGLPAVVTLTLAIGTHRLAQQGAIVKRLASVETLGSTSVICSDKTGTLTMNEMTVRLVAVGPDLLGVTGEGYGVDGVVESPDRGDDTSGLRRLAVAAVLCNDSHVRDGHLIGDPTEGALVVLAAKLGVDADTARRDSPRVAEVPFDSARKVMVTYHRRVDGDDGGPAAGAITAVVKGAWEIVVPLCASVTDARGSGSGERPIEASDRERWGQQAAAMAAQGLRVLALAERPLDAGLVDRARVEGDDALIEATDALTLLGLVGMMDPARPEAADAVARCHRAGIKVTMVTGDHLDTARAIAAQLGITGEAYDGRSLDDMIAAGVDDEALGAVLARTGVVARVSPQHKVRVVRALRAHGAIVAMTGDGVNDAPALSAADIGIAMGNGGTEVAKESADMVLADDNFATIERAVEQGRGIYENIVKFVRFQVATNIGALTTFITAQLFGLPVPFNPIQILWINLIMDGPPAMGLGVDPVAPGVMDRPPRGRNEQILSPHRLRVVFITGLLMTAATLGVFLVVRHDAGEAHALTAAFTTFVLLQVANALIVRDEHHTIFQSASLRNAQLWLSLVGVVVLQALAVHTPIGHRVFSTVGLSPAHWALAVAAMLGLVAADELRKISERHQTRPRSGVIMGPADQGMT
jgi:Ca2+-transporting ATPase